MDDHPPDPNPGCQTSPRKTTPGHRRSRNRRLLLALEHDSTLCITFFQFYGILSRNRILASDSGLPPAPFPFPNPFTLVDLFFGHLFASDAPTPYGDFFDLEYYDDGHVFHDQR